MKTGTYRNAEYALLCRCCRREAISGEEFPGTSSYRVVDWPLLIAGAYSNDLVSPLYFHIAGCAQNVLPQPVLLQLHELWWEKAVRNLALASELLRILELLQHASIRAVPFKGPSLAVQLYGNILLRDSSDIDILVDRQDVNVVCKVLRSSGYLPADGCDWKSASLVFNQKDVTLVHPDTLIIVEIHWTFTSPELARRFDLHPLWARLTSISFGDKSVPALCLEDLILVLCIHGARHCWDRLKWVADITAILSSSAPVNWLLVFRRAEDAGCRRMLLLGLILARDIANAPLPANLPFNSREVLLMERLAAHIGRRLLTQSRMNLFEVYRFQMRIREQLWDRIPVLHAFFRGRLRSVVDHARKRSVTIPCSTP
jgi:Uncharacterised nucleotidyltransferase